MTEVKFRESLDELLSQGPPVEQFQSKQGGGSAHRNLREGTQGPQTNMGVSPSIIRAE